MLYFTLFKICMTKLQFPTRTDFETEVRARVQRYFQDNQLPQTGTAALHLKTLGICLSIAVLYYFLVLETQSLALGLVLTFLFAQVNILLAFNVMHDGGHGSFSSKRWLNTLAAGAMDFLGSSSLLWRQKHNNLHHTYTNVAGKDDDLDVGGMIRLSTEDTHKPWHRYQHIYAPFLYAFLSLYLLLYSDWERFHSKKIGSTPLQTFGWKELSFFVATKVFYIGYMLIFPMFFQPVWAVVLCFLFFHFVLGLTLSIIFQLAHTVEETEFPVAQDNHMPYSWLEHQLRTTCNFAVNNAFLTFYCGGLNYQIEHHLFHKVSHVHYPAISRIVKSTCQEYGKPYHESPSFFKALGSHIHYLKRVGQA